MSNSTYFRGFNGVRFLAASTVVIHHIEKMKASVGLPYISGSHILSGMGLQAVNLFFTLSGFLISYLLFEEMQKTGSISIRHFYLRRVLRILPLYFAIVLIGFGIVPNLPSDGSDAVSQMLASFKGDLARYFGPALTLYLTMLPNLSILLFPRLLLATQAWSIGVEEQFYLLWPWVLRRFYRHYPWVVLAFVGARIVAIRICLWANHLWYDGQSQTLAIAFEYILNLKLDFMAIGGLGAYLIFKKQDRILRFLIHPVLKAASIPGLIALMLLGWKVEVRAFGLICPVLSTLFLMNLCSSRLPARILELSPFRYLGQISYGIYMLHPAAILMSLMAFQGAGLFFAESHPYAFWLNALFYLTAFGVTFALASLSYRYFESPFLKLKRYGTSKT